MFGCMLLSYIYLATMRANLVVLTPTERIQTLEQYLDKPNAPLISGLKAPAAFVVDVSLS